MSSARHPAPAAPLRGDAARAVVTRWLHSISHRPTEERLAELVPHARDYPDGSPEHRAVRRILADHGVPTPAAVHAEVAAEAGRARARAARHRTRAAQALTAVPPNLGPRVAAWVADYRLRHGTGPTWAETVRATGLPDFTSRTTITYLIRHLVETGWLDADSGQRGLRPGSRYEPPDQG